MSEQVSIQTEELESTSEKLDSILDRLNALGASAAKLKIDSPPLHSVPDLPAVEAEGDTIVEATPGPVTTDGVAELADEPEAEAAPLQPPAIPQLDLVPPVLDEDFDISHADVDVPDITTLTDTRGAEPLVAPEVPESLIGSEPLEAVDMGEPFESVTVVTDIDPDSAGGDTVGFEDSVVSAEEVELAEAPSPVMMDETPVVVAAGTPADEAVIDAPVAEAPVAEAPVAEAPVAEAAFEDAPVDVLEPTADFDPWAIDETVAAPVPEAAVGAPTEIATEFTEPSGVTENIATENIATENVVTDLFDVEETVEVAETAETSMEFAAPDEALEAEVHYLETPDPEAQVFVPTDPIESVEQTSSPVETPEAPTSIFGSSMAPAATTSETQEEQVAETGETDGWISHHDEPGHTFETQSFEPQLVEEPDSSAVDTQAFAPSPFDNVDAVTATDLDTSETEVEDQWDFNKAAPVFFDQDAHEAATSVTIASEVEDTLNDLATFEAEEPSLTPEPAAAEFTEGDVFTSDEDLPLPDFTGVYAEEEESEGTTGGVASRIEGLSMRRDELDQLRPSNDDFEGKIADLEERRAAKMPLSTIICFIVMIALAVMVFMWFSDAAALEDINNGLDSIFG